MSQFTKPLRIEQDADHPKFWTVLDGFEYHVGHLGSGEVLSVPAGFRTDFQSIPKAVRWAFGHPVDEYAASGLEHDWLYQHPANGNLVGVVLSLGVVDGSIGVVDRKPKSRSRRRCDQIYLEMNKVLKCPWWKRTGKYTGVRIGGWVGWRKYRKAERKARRIAEKCKEYREAE